MITFIHKHEIELRSRPSLQRLYCSFNSFSYNLLKSINRCFSLSCVSPITQICMVNNIV